MSGPAAFSRLQLAAALIEYDNDPSTNQIRSAADSAIFAQFRRNERPQSVMSRKSADYLGVALPSEKGSVGGRESVLLDNGETRRSRSSIDMLRNPFSATEEGEEYEEETPDVDLESWGLNNLLTKDKGKEPEKQARMPNPHDIQSAQGPRRPTTGARTTSMGNMDDFGAGGAFLDAPQTHRPESHRSRSLGSALDMEEAAAPEDLIPRGRRQSAHALIDNLPVTPPLHAVPFPSSPNAAASNEHHTYRSSSVDPRPPHPRTYSTASMGSRMFLNDDPAPSRSPERRSRFDSQGNRIRTVSTMAPSAVSGDENNPFSLRPPSPSRSSRFDPKAAAHARTMSNASLGSRLLLDDAATGRSAVHSTHMSRLDMLRPKVLIMPSPLQNAAQPKAEPKVRDGFHLTSDGPPLPAGAKSASKSAVMMPDGSLFTPNPRGSLSLAQLTFRSTLYDNGGGYSDLSTQMPRATEEGEQAQEPESPIDEGPPIVDVMPGNSRNSRGPGKLYGRSLIDDLENRKAEIRGKRRVFTGDERPSMMARSSTYSTLIDPASLQRPASQHMDSSNSGTSLGRRKTLLNLDGPNEGTGPDARKSQLALGARTSNVKSTFGVDTLWEREMAKLRAMEAADKAEQPKDESPSRSLLDKENQIPSPAPVLPEIQRASTKKGPPPPDAGDDEESDSDASEVYKPSQKKQNKDGDWFSDEEKRKPEPVRTIGSGPRYPKGKGRSAPINDGDDSEEDLPLAATVDRIVERATRFNAADDDSDEDKPLTKLVDKTKLKLPPMNFDRQNGEDEDEDDKPLGLRASHIAGDEDDRPLALHPEHQRRTQYQMLAQQQQYAQQQMMMQAQFQSSMMFAQPSLMGSGFFGPPMAPLPMAAVPMPGPMTPPPEQDANKFGRVDRWRHDVAVEGEP